MLKNHNGLKANHILQVRLNKEQKLRLEALANASGYTTLSDFARTSLLNPSIEYKLNQILKILQDGGVQDRKRSP